MRYYYVYILLCSDGRYYTGMTNNVPLRFAQHQDGVDTRCYTYKRRPVELVYTEKFQWVQHAIAWEKQLKGWTVAKKKALIDGDFDRLQALAQCMNRTSHALRKKT